MNDGKKRSLWERRIAPAIASFSCAVLIAVNGCDFTTLKPMAEQISGKAATTITRVEKYTDRKGTELTYRYLDSLVRINRLLGKEPPRPSPLKLTLPDTIPTLISHKPLRTLDEGQLKKRTACLENGEIFECEPCDGHDGLPLIDAKPSGLFRHLNGTYLPLEKLDAEFPEASVRVYDISSRTLVVDSGDEFSIDSGNLGMLASKMGGKINTLDDALSFFKTVFFSDSKAHSALDYITNCRSGMCLYWDGNFAAGLLVDMASKRPYVVSLYSQNPEQTLSTIYALMSDAFLPDGLYLEADLTRRQLSIIDSGKVLETISIVRGRGIDKLRLGDKRTPLGLYHLCEMHDSYWYKFVQFDYPSPHDALRGLSSGTISPNDYKRILSSHKRGKCPPLTKLGAYVGIHSTSSEGPLPNWDWTYGCLAMDRPDMDKLAKFMRQRVAKGERIPILIRR